MYPLVPDNNPFPSESFVRLLLAIRRRAIKDYRLYKRRLLPGEKDPKIEWNESMCCDLLHDVVDYYIEKDRRWQNLKWRL